MATLLNDTEIRRLMGTVLVDGDAESVRPNSYVLRLGSEGEFLNTGKEFKIGDRKKKGLRVPPGNSVGVTAFETVDFRRETVHKIYPDHDLHGLISPTTDLSREGIVAPTTQVDAGYYGTLNWTLTNTSSEERRFVYKERLFRLTILKLAPGESPDQLYAGEYQSQLGYVRSRRQGPPVGMKEGEWEDGHVKGGPEDALETLLKSGYPWHMLGQRLKAVDQQMKTVTDEYGDIRDAIERVTADVTILRDQHAGTGDTVRRVLRDETASLQNRWLIGAGSLLLGAVGLALSVASNEGVRTFVQSYGTILGLVLVGLSTISLFLVGRRA